MDSFNRSSGFRYNPNPNSISSDEEDLGILEIYVHHARNIHNICIYDNQDVYAKFSLTYNPDEIHSTGVVTGGGKNPIFNENLMMKFTQKDAVIKCEIWMLSRARHFMEDQLLGFALVPISDVIGKGKVVREYSLSSTDLIHSPAGTVKLTLSILPINPFSGSGSGSDVISSVASSELVLLEQSESFEYSRLEFPDINVVKENQDMVTQYFNGLNSKSDLFRVASFLHLGNTPNDHIVDYEMAGSSSEENQLQTRGPIVMDSTFLSSTTTSLTDEKTSPENRSSSVNKSLPTSKKVTETTRDEKCSSFATQKNDDVTIKDEPGNNIGSIELGLASIGPDVNLEAEQSAMQKRIVDMYMRSMHQFTESLAKMKLPMDLGSSNRRDDNENAIQSRNAKLDSEKKDGSRVFYGSRAFF